MEAVATATAEAKSRVTMAILTGGLIAGVLDITFAFVRSGINGRTPINVLHSVASGLLGQPAYSGGVPVAILGLVLHFLIATIWTTIYVVASRPLTFLVRYAAVCGILYGVIIYVGMNFVVLPLSAVPFKITYTAPVWIPGLLCHMFLIGLPIALVTRRFSGPDSTPSPATA